MWDALWPWCQSNTAGLSRTAGPFGFVETAWEPVPYAVLSVVAELVAVLAAGVWAVRATPGVGSRSCHVRHACTTRVASVARKSA